MAHIALEIGQHHSKAISGRAEAVLHITLCHLGKLTWEQTQHVVGKLNRGVRTLPSMLQMRATEYLVFGSPDEPVMVRRVTCENYDLESYRAGLADALETQGIAVSRKFEPWLSHVSVGIKDACYASGDVAFSVTRIGLFAGPILQHYSFYLGE